MQTTELRERLASAFHADRSFGDWTSAYLKADIALGAFKSHATIADLKHKKVIGESPKFDERLTLVTCSCGGMSGVFCLSDDIDEVFDNHLENLVT